MVALALLLFSFNFWAISMRNWPAVLDFEVPSRAALADGHWWTLFSYALTSTGLGTVGQWLSGPLSILFFFMAARLTESELPRRDFLLLCAVCAVGAAACWLPLHWSSGESLRAGCTVLVLGLGSFLCFALPDESLPLNLIVTVPVRPQGFFWFILALETGAFLSFELPQVLGHAGVFQADFDHSAHIGAMLSGWACARYWRRLHAEDDWAFFVETALERRPAVPVAAVGAVDAETAQASPESRRELREAVDRILDKINHDGLASLSPQERQILTRAKDLLGK